MSSKNRMWRCGWAHPQSANGIGINYTSHSNAELRVHKITKQYNYTKQSRNHAGTYNFISRSFPGFIVTAASLGMVEAIYLAPDCIVTDVP